MGTNAISKSYLETQLLNMKTALDALYVIAESGKSLISAEDLAKIGTNASAITGLTNLIGTIPADASSATIVDYILEAVADGAFDDTALSGRVTTVEGQITILNGGATVEGSVLKTVNDEINKFATTVTDNGTIDTIKEAIDYISAHGAEYATLLAEVQGNTSAISTLNGTGAGSVANSISTAVGALGDDKDGNPYATVKAYVDAKAAEAQTNATVSFETENINFATLFA